MGSSVLVLRIADSNTIRGLRQRVDVWVSKAIDMHIATEGACFYLRQLYSEVFC